MGFIEATNTGIRKSFQISGRATRSEFWWFQLALIAIFIPIKLLDFLFSGSLKNQGMHPIFLAYFFFYFVSYVTVFVRRLHDVNLSGLYMLAPLIIAFATLPLVFWEISILYQNELTLTIIATIAGLSHFLVFFSLFSPSNPNPNKYGPNPSEVPS